MPQTPTNSAGILARDLLALGIHPGDHVLVRADYALISPAHLRTAKTLVDAILTYLGTEGSVMALTYTKQFILPQFRPGLEPFSLTSPTTSGTFSKQVLAHPTCLRSPHPTNSVAVAGNTKPWRSSLQAHGPDAGEYDPIQTLVDLGGKLLVFGCVGTSPGFTTVHLVQQELGHGRRHPLSGLVGARYLDPSGKNCAYTRRHIGGCSLGFGNLFPAYIEAQALRSATFLGAPAVAISAREALAVDRAVLQRAPETIRCSRPHCLDCRVLVRWKNPDLARFLIAQARLVLQKSTQPRPG